MIHRLVAIIDRTALGFGHALAVLVVAMVLVMNAVVWLRYGFGYGSILLQDLVTYLYASVLMLGMGYALRQDGHVRVDIFYRGFSPRTRAWINLAGSVLALLPFCLFVLACSRGYVAISWQIREASSDPAGIPAVFLLKSLIPAMAVLLLVQGVAEALRAVATLRGDPLPPNHPPQPPGEVL